MAESLRDLEITRDELDRFGEALKNKEFRDLLVEYCDEIRNPENRKKYEEDIIQLEKERGVNVTFVHPEPGYVIKTSADGNKLAFINVCTSDLVEKPRVQIESKNGSRGQQWSLPHLMSPPREDMSKNKSRCNVYDVIFHPDTMQFASRSTQFRDMMNNISVEAVETNFDVTLDKANLKFPKLSYKGIARPVVIRKKIGDVAEIENPDEIDKIYSDMYKKMDQVYDSSKGKPVKNNNNHNKKDDVTSAYATPKYIIKHRSDVDMQDFTNDPDSKLSAATPKELIVEINLPLLKSSADLQLDVTEKSLKLVSEKPSKYKLDITMPYSVNEDAGNAKFDVDTRKLVVILPVKRKSVLLLDIGRYDSGVDSDHSPVADSPSDNSLPLIEELQLEDKDSGVCESSSVQSESEVFRTSAKSSGFLNPDIHYSFPENSCHLFDNILAFTLHVKNVDSDSIKKEHNESLTSIHLKFTSISSGFFPQNYAFFLHLPSHFIDSVNVSIETWDNNVIVQIPYKPCDKILSIYYVGATQEITEEKLVAEPSIINNKHLELISEKIDNSTKSSVEVHLDSDDEVTIIVTSENSPEKQVPNFCADVKSKNDIPSFTKNRSYSESSADEFSTGHSPSKAKSILKGLYSRFSVSRSVSESSVDDYIWSSSYENCAATSESLIPEEGEISSSMKKTVRFNDVVSEKLYRSNSSILGQRKKNQRKARNKKKAYERRVSESETSEAEDKKEKSNENENFNGTDGEKNNDKLEFKSDLIFDIDI